MRISDWSSDVCSSDLAPTVVLEPGDDARVMQDEIFGPILPIRGYRDLDDAIAYVESRDRPLAPYPFSHDRATVQRLLGRLLAGVVPVHDTLMPFAAGTRPVGALGPTGMGPSHGRP